MANYDTRVRAVIYASVGIAVALEMVAVRLETDRSPELGASLLYTT